MKLANAKEPTNECDKNTWIFSFVGGGVSEIKVILINEEQFSFSLSSQQIIVLSSMISSDFLWISGKTSGYYVPNIQFLQGNTQVFFICCFSELIGNCIHAIISRYEL